jgi:hypothetical protein
MTAGSGVMGHIGGDKQQIKLLAIKLLMSLPRA